MNHEARSPVAPVISRLSERNHAMFARRSDMEERATDAELAQVSSSASFDAETERPPPDRVPPPSADLVHTVTNHIIPRLLLAHHMEARGVDRVAEARKPPTDDEVAILVEIAVAQDLQGGMKQVEARLREGLSLESILLDWIAGAARLLGDQWLADERSFADVTLGLGSLHRLLAMLRHRFKPPLRHRGLVVLVTAPGEQHTLAIHVLGDLLQHAGWEAVVRPNLAEDELVAMVSCEPVVMVGISVSSEAFLAPVSRIVNQVLETSLNRALAVMLGGAMDMSSFAEEVGAMYCTSARGALGWLDRHAKVSFERGLNLVTQRSS